MTKTIALFALLALMVLNTLGNYWFTYGIWPRSWVALVVFSLTAAALHGLMTYVAAEGRK